MANTYSQIYLQAVFAVKYRAALLDKVWRPKIQGVIGNLINETGCKTIIVNGMEDHMHCFLGLRPAVSASDLMKTIKAKSSKYINEHKLVRERFEWQPGFGIFSYRQQDIDQIYNYVKNQEEHHRKQTFKNEYLDLVNEFKVEYDEQYLFQELI